ncbi:MAG: WbqC family protein [Thermodesulfobium sp.]
MCGSKKMKKVIAILQSNYIPWKGYFDIIGMSDEFVLYDDVQYTKGDWRNRNKIKTPNGTEWLTLPVNSKGRLTQGLKIQEVTIKDPSWGHHHWKTISQNYSKAPFFKEYSPFFADFYLKNTETLLSQVNYQLIKIVCHILDIKTRLSWSIDYSLSEDKNLRLVEICQQLQATHYLSGPAAKSYLDEALFKKNNIDVLWMDYSGYPEYTQLYPPFEHGVSIIDLIFNEGAQAQKYMKGFLSS